MARPEWFTVNSAVIVCALRCLRTPCVSRCPFGRIASRRVERKQRRLQEQRFCKIEWTAADGEQRLCTHAGEELMGRQTPTSPGEVRLTVQSRSDAWLLASLPPLKAQQTRSRNQAYPRAGRPSDCCCTGSGSASRQACSAHKQRRKTVQL
eukprot:5210810-Pleurochrysis_carterae.AAC.5